MLKLKYLFDNKELAQMIIENWNYEKKDETFLKYYRISSNAIYWCSNDGELFFLRFAPTSEKKLENLLAELDFLRYLKNNGYPCVETILSKNKKELEIIDTPWGEYYAVAFTAAKGNQVSEIAIDSDVAFVCGKNLGWLHRLSSQYDNYVHSFESWEDKLNWVEHSLKSSKLEEAVDKELSDLKEKLADLEINKANYGIVHYDFEPDNLFYDVTDNKLMVIDFEDAMTNWYALDILKAIDNLTEEVEPNLQEEIENQFFEGYKSEYSMDIEMLEAKDLFDRFDNLYSYARIIDSTNEKWENEPEWMENLRKHLKFAADRKKSNFKIN